MHQEKRTATAQIRLRPSLKELAERAADDEARTFSSFVEWLIIKYLKEQKYLSQNYKDTGPDN
jgi:hypothetical protein